MNAYELLASIELPVAALNCRNLNCSNKSHLQELEIFYNNILDALKKAGLHLTCNKSENYTQRPGWNDYVSDLYKYSKSCRRNWREANEPRHGIIHEEYIKSKARFKYALRFINKN